MPMNQGMPPGKGAPEGNMSGQPRIKSRTPLPPENDDEPKREKGSRLFGSGDKENTARAGGGLSIAIPQGLVAGISSASGIVYGGILCVCLVIALIAYGTTHKASGKTYNIPTDMVTYNGLFRDIYENALTGGFNKPAGPMYDENGTEVPAAPTAIGEETAAGMGTQDQGTAESGAQDNTAGASEGSASGAAMVVDSGSGTDGYKQAESYNELLTQLETAMASGDKAFVGTKLAYEDESGNLKGFPESVVDHFVTYMSTNSDKRSAFINELSNDKYSGQNGSAFVVKLPLIKFVVNMGYDDTTISLPGFSDQVVNAGQSADIAPLLPCMYTLTISNPAWSEPVTRDIEANVNEATISINIKP